MNMANPASVHCEQTGGKLELRQDAAGNAVGMCVLPDGTECEEWAYFRDQCGLGAATATPDPASATGKDQAGDTEIAADGCQVYRNKALGYSFHYPQDARIEVNDDPLKSISIAGPAFKDSGWPLITISHPGDREEYLPPKDADLEDWLAEHNLIAGIPQPNERVDGTVALHTRHERSPQTYAFDSYFFARSGQLYQILIGHVGDKEDWGFYTHFLMSFEFSE
jgi:hypothetical protein